MMRAALPPAGFVTYSLMFDIKQTRAATQCVTVNKLELQRLLHFAANQLVCPRVKHLPPPAPPAVAAVRG